MGFDKIIIKLLKTSEFNNLFSSDAIICLSNLFAGCDEFAKDF